MYFEILLRVSEDLILEVNDAVVDSAFAGDVDPDSRLDGGLGVRVLDGFGQLVTQRVATKSKLSAPLRFERSGRSAGCDGDSFGFGGDVPDQETT